MMRDWTVTGPQKPLEPVEASMPQPVGHEVVLEVTHCGVCHTDLHFWEGVVDVGAPTPLPVTAMGVEYPFTLGHEVVGRVVAMGPDVRDVEVGDVRLVYPWLGCGTCAACQGEEDNLCEQQSAIGFARPGGFGAYVAVPHPRYLLEFGGIEPARAATYACSGLTVYSAIRKLPPPSPGETVVVIGAGGLGMAAIALLPALGYDRVAVIDRDPAKLDEARALGASLALAGNDNWTDTLLAEMGGAPFAILDFVNSPQTVEAGCALLRRRGVMVLVGMFGGAARLPLVRIPIQEIVIKGSFVGSLPELRELLDLVRERRATATPIACRPRDQATDALADMRDGRVIGRIVLTDAENQ